MIYVCLLAPAHLRCSPAFAAPPLRLTSRAYVCVYVRILYDTISFLDSAFLTALAVPGSPESDSQPTLSEQSVIAASTQATLLLLAARCDGELIARLEANVAAASFHASAALTSAAAAVVERVSSFLSADHLHAQAADKLLEMCEDEIDAGLKMFRACLLQSCVNDATQAFFEDTISTAHAAIDRLNVFPSISAVRTLPVVHFAERVDGASHIVLGIEPARCTVSHLPWLARGQWNRVTITLADSAGEPVLAVTPDDVFLTADSGALGWCRGPVSVESNAISFGLFLEPTCSDDAAINTHIGSNLVLFASHFS